MRCLRYGALALLFGVTACTQAATATTEDGAALSLFSGGWLAVDDVTVPRPALAARPGGTRAGDHAPRRRTTGGGEAGQRPAGGRKAGHRMIVRGMTEDGVRPLSVSFVGPESFGPAPDGGDGFQPAHFDPARLVQGPSAPRILPAASYLQCVPFARELSGIALRGNAWTWWGQAEGRYRRTGRPQAGAVMVLSRSDQIPLGHLAVVTEVLSDRAVVVSHANWLNKGNIHADTPVIDVSPDNDWSMIRAWYTPGKTMGLNVYAVSGFILPDPIQSARSTP
jgi:hypothetical protein